MTCTNIFKRYELKFMLTPSQRTALLEAMEGYMKEDDYGKTVIRNVYYDTPDFRLIRKSLEKPVYKEKLRVRSYSKVTPGDPVFVEIKKKYQGVVFKRRITVPEDLTEDWLRGKSAQPVRSQIADEIDYFKDCYRYLRPACFLSYEREAFYDLKGSDLRITLDRDILGRTYDMSLTKGIYGDRILPRDITLLEIKTSGSMPLWLVTFLTENKIRKTSFSKYGAYFEGMIDISNTTGGLLYA